jgi:hypothetical protein
MDFTLNGTASGTVSLMAPASQLSLRAKGAQCSGSPQVVVTVDGAQVQSSNINQNFFSDYTVILASNLATGSHAVGVTVNFTDNSTQYKGNSGKAKCSPTLSIDKLSFLGDGGETPNPLAVNVLVPTNGSTVSGGVPVEAAPSSGTTAARVEFLLDGVLKATDSTAPYCMVGTGTTCSSWDSTTVTNGTHTITAYGYDSAGNKSPASTVSFTVSNTTSTVGGIYWGAYIDGDPTYNYYYPGQGTYNSTCSALDSTVKKWCDAPWDQATYDKFETNAGKKISILSYGQPSPRKQSVFYGGTADIATKRGAIPLITIGTDDTSRTDDVGDVTLADIANGAYDSYIISWADNVKAYGKPFFLRLNWEMNGTWFSWGRQAAQNPDNYKRMWQRFHDVAVSRGATNITWVWCPNLVFSTSTPLSSLYPGDAYVDWTCIDGYNMGSSSVSFTSLYTNTYNQLMTIAPSKPIMIGEISSREYSGAKASWISSTLNTELPKFPKIKAMVWFNWRIYENNVYNDWPIESSASANSAFKSAIASPYYLPASSNYVNLTPLTKVPVPNNN